MVFCWALRKNLMLNDSTLTRRESASFLPLHSLRAVHSEFRQVLLWTNSRRDCFIAPSSRKSSQIPFPPFTELHTLSLILLGACRTLRDFVTRHIGLDGNLSHQFEYRVQTRFRICLVLLHISMQVV